MAWKDGFVIEYTASGDSPHRGRRSCTKCIHYRKNGKCAVIGKLYRDCGYGSWKYCGRYVEEEDTVRHNEPMPSYSSTSKKRTVARRKKPRIIIYQEIILVEHAHKGLGRLIAENGSTVQVIHQNNEMRNYLIQDFASKVLKLMEQDKVDQYKKRFDKQTPFRECAFPIDSSVEHAELGKGKVTKRKSTGRIIRFGNKDISFSSEDLANPKLWLHYGLGSYQEFKRRNNI